MRGILDFLVAPAVRLVARLTMVWKIVLVAAFLLVPTLLLGAGYRSGIAAQTSFAASEEAGIHYARPLMGLIAQTVELRSANVRTALGQPTGATRAATARSAIAANVNELNPIVEKDLGGLSLAPQWQAARTAVANLDQPVGTMQRPALGSGWLVGRLRGLGRRGDEVREWTWATT